MSEEYEYPNLLCATIANGDFDLARNLLNLGSNPNLVCKASGKTPLEIAIKQNNPYLVKLVIEKEGDFSSNSGVAFKGLLSRINSQHDLNHMGLWLDILVQGLNNVPRSHMNIIKKTFEGFNCLDLFRECFVSKKISKKNLDLGIRFLQIAFTHFSDSLVGISLDYSSKKKLIEYKNYGYGVMNNIVHVNWNKYPEQLENILKAIDSVGQKEVLFKYLKMYEEDVPIGDGLHENLAILKTQAEKFFLTKNIDNHLEARKVKL